MADSKPDYGPFDSASSQGGGKVDYGPFATGGEDSPGAISDLATAAKKGVLYGVQGAVGLADYAGKGEVGKAVKDSGVDLSGGQQKLEEQYSPEMQAQEQYVNEGKGFWEPVYRTLTSPRYAINKTVESVAPMVISGGIARGVQAAESVVPRLATSIGGRAVAAGAGEGVLTAGQDLEQLRDQSDTGLVTGKDKAAATISGVATAAFGGAGAAAEGALGVFNPQSLFLKGARDAVEGNVVGRMAKGFVVEAAEEAGQNAAEQASMNWAQGKPIMDQVAEQAGQGAGVGGVMGAAFGSVPGNHHVTVGANEQPEHPPQNVPEAQAPIGPLQAAAAIGKTSGAVQDGSTPQTPASPVYGGVRGLIAEAAKKYGVDPTTALTISSIETGGKFNSDAANPESSARGVFQFMDKTRKMFPEVTPEMWADPKVQAEYGAKFIAQTNALMAQQLGRAPTTAEAYMGHLLGAHGATTLLNADPNTPVKDVIAQYDPKRATEIARVNGMSGMTAGEAVAKWEGAAQRAQDRLGVEQNAFPFESKDGAQMRATAAAREGQMLEVVEHPNVPGRFAALPPMGGDPNEAQPASKVPLIADTPRYDEDPTKPAAPAQAVESQTQGQAATADAGQPAAVVAAEGGGAPVQGLAVPGQQPGVLTDARSSGTVSPEAGGVPAGGVAVPAAGGPLQTAGASVQAGGQPAALAGGVPVADEQAARQALIAQRGLVPGQDYNPNPTNPQKNAGNYKMAHESFEGLPLSVENPAGSTRVAQDGSWSVDMSADYGYIKRTKAADSTSEKADRIDFYKPMDAVEGAPVYVIDQIDPKTSAFDEHKVVLGVTSAEQAQLIYDQHFNDNSGPARRAQITEMSMPEFKQWLRSGTTETTPAVVAQPTVREQRAVADGVLPQASPEGDVAPGLFPNVPAAAKYAADNGINAAPVQTEGGYALAPKLEPQVLTDDDHQRLASLNGALREQGIEDAAPLRETPPPALAVAQHVAQQAFGVKVVAIEPHQQFDGVAFGDRAYVSPQEQHPVVAITGHEVTHLFEDTPLGARLSEITQQYARNYSQQVNQRQSEEQMAAGAPVSKQYAANEVTADLNGSMWIDSKFWNELATRDTSMFRKVAYKFMELATKAVQVAKGSRFDASTIVSDVGAARAAIAQAWADHLGGKLQPSQSQALTFSSKLPDQTVFEVAPDPRNAELKAAWDRLPDQRKWTVSNKVARSLIREAMPALGVQGRLRKQFGGFGDDSNPSMSVVFPQGTDPAKVDALTRVMGHALSQQSMMRTSPEPFPGSSPMNAIAIQYPKGSDASKLHQLYTSLRQIKDANGEPYVQGHTTAEGAMVILDDGSRIGGEALARMIADHLGEPYSVSYDTIHASFPEAGTNDYGFKQGESNVQGQNPAVAGGTEPSLRQLASQLRDSAQQRLASTVAERRPAIERSEHPGAERAGGERGAGAEEVKKSTRYRERDSYSITGKDGARAVFHSALAQEVDKQTAKALPAIGWKAFIKGLVNKGAIKQDEVTWSGLDTWLDARTESAGPQAELFERPAPPKITKEEVQAFVAANGVQLRESVAEAKTSQYDKESWIEDRAESLQEDKQSEWERYRDRQMENFDSSYYTREIDDPDDIRKYADDANVEISDETPDDELPHLWGVFTDNGRRPESVHETEEEADEEYTSLRDSEWSEYEDQLHDDYFDGFDAHEEAEAEWENEEGDSEGETKFKTYSLPGGENYREIKLILPSGASEAQQFTRANAEEARKYLEANGYLTSTVNGMTNEFAVGEANRKNARASEKYSFTDSHWDEGNVLAHIRVKDRTTSDPNRSFGGERSLFVEEIQSDWAQQGREEGFKNTRELKMVGQPQEPLVIPSDLQGKLGPDAMEYKFLDVATGDHYASWGDDEEHARENLMVSIPSLRTEGKHDAAPFIAKREYVVQKDGKEVGRTDKEGKEHRVVYGSREEAEAAAQKAGGTVVDKGYGPATEKWVELTLKRIVKMAVDEGYERVAFVTGQQTADRYDMRSEVDRIQYRPAANDENGNSRFHVAVYGTGYGRLIVNDYFDAKGLRDTLGQELAKKIMEGQGEKANADESTGTKILREDNLIMGGEGHLAFYDQMVPSILNKLLPKLGGEKLEVAKYAIAKGNRDDARGPASDRDQLSFKVTDAMRQKAMGSLPLFSRKAAQNTLKDVTGLDVKGRVTGKMIDARPALLQFLGGRQIAEVYGKSLPQLPKYQKLVQLMQAGVNDNAAKADKVASDWGRIKDRPQLANLMHDSTLAQMDPSKPFVMGDSQSQYKELRARWDKLTPEAKATYTAARDMYEEHYAQVRQAIRDRISRAELSAPKKSELLTRMDGEFFERIKGVYFPLARFGDYVIVVRDQDGKVASVNRAETSHEAEVTRAALKKEFGNGYSVSAVIRSAEFNASRDSVGTEFLQSLFKVLDQTGIGEDLQDDINQLVLSSMPDLSWAKHGIHRKGTAGFSEDARRAFAQNMFHGARYLQRVRFGDRLEGQLREAEKYVKGRNELTNSVKEQQVLNEVRKRHDLMMNPKSHPLAQTLNSFGFLFHLGLSPASAIVNMTQTPLIAYPIVAARFGYAKTLAAFTKASAEAVKTKNDMREALKGDEKKALQEAIDSGVVDVTLAHDLAGIAQGNDSGVAWKLQPIMRAASFMFHHAERFNRQATFVAAYRLAREAGQGHDTAVETASDMTIASHFDYSSSNRPRVMQGNWQKVILQFKQYSQNMTYTLANATRLSFTGATPQERSEARKQLAGLVVMNGLAAGMLGVPVVAQILSLASMIGGSDDEPWDAKVALQNYLAQTFGQKTAEVMMHGASRYTPSDISGRTSLDLYKMWFPDVSEAENGKAAFDDFMAGLAGPVIGGIGGGIAKAMQEFSKGEYERGLEWIAPAIARGPLKAYRFATEGVKDEKGVVIKDEVPASGITGQAFGFRPSDVANAMEGRGAVMNMDLQLQQRRSALIDQFVRAAMAGDDTSKEQGAIAHYNEANPNRFIGPMHLAAAERKRALRIATAQDGVYLPLKRRDVLQQGAFANPDR